MREDIRKERPKRIPLGQRNIMTVSGLNDREEYVYRWINDTNERIMNVTNAGYEFVDKSGKVVGDGTLESAKSSGSVLSKQVGKGVTAYLMKIPREFWEADRKERVDKPANEWEAGMKEQEKERGRYGKVEIEENRK